MTVVEYEAASALPHHFLVLHDHVFPDEDVVEDAASFVIVGKVEAGAEMAAMLVPRLA